MRVLYIVYWGALEQLGQSLVVPSVLNLSKRGAQITLVTFEKPADLEDRFEVDRVSELFEKNKVDWIPLKYHQTPKVPATAFDAVQGIVAGLWKRLSGRFDIVHARTFQAGLIGMILAPLIRARFVYHNEGFYPGEQVDAGNWGIESKQYLYSKKLETKMYRRADAVFALSKRSVDTIREFNDLVAVVPSCVDLDHFRFEDTGSEGKSGIVYLGSTGGRYDLASIGKFVAAAMQKEPGLKLNIVSKTPRDQVSNELAETGLAETDWNLEAVDYSRVPDKLASAAAGIHFLKKGIAGFAGSPTKIGEYWAMGLPVIVTPMLGDTDLIAVEERIGVVVREHNDVEYQRAFEELEQLLQSKGIARRCRNAAERHYGLETACSTQFSVYEELAA
jgi:glycosyltransferase involved in cell wall biosynthesis